MIGYLTTEYPGLTTYYGGIGTSIRDLVHGLLQRNMAPHVILINDFEDSVRSMDGVTLVMLKRVRLPGLTAFLTGAKISRIVNDLVSQGKLDVLEVPDWTGLSAFVKVSCPVVMRLNGSETYFKYLVGKSSRLRYRFLEKRAFLQANHIISVSQHTADVTNKVFHSNRNMEVIPNAVDATGFVPADAVVEKPTILYFGTLARKKGVLELPIIFEMVRKSQADVKLLVIGRDNPDADTGSQSTWMLMQKQFDSFRGMEVQYIPGLPRQEMIAHIQRATVCVFPSYAEALPVSWLEAMSCGKPIVASNIGWASEIITDGVNGLMAHPSNHQMFADKINLLLSDSDLRHQIGGAARKTILDRFSSKVVLDHYLRFYSKVLGKSIAA